MKNNTLTLKSKVKDIYANPIGKDVIGKIFLQLGINEELIKKPFIMNLKLSTLAKISKCFLDADFFNTLLHLLNSEKDTPRADTGKITKKWWKEAVFYQIYPRSFKDSNGDGIGDLGGIIEKLDYLKDLGVDALWLSPIYDSPNDDNGYDIRNYFDIMKEFGTMKDFDLLLTEVHKRGMRLIMDLVVNHTSDEHAWFKVALTKKESRYRNYYIFRESKDGPPNNWTSFFSGSAWNQYKDDTWALHLFSKKQMDLNWDNENVREEIAYMVDWWLEKGVDGFRLDVINYISKEPGLPNGNKVISDLMGYCGVEHYFYGPNLHQYLRELRKKSFTPHDAFSVGETPGIGMEMSKLLTADYRKELDMIFSFDHLENPGKVRFDDYKYDLNYLKKYMIKWQEEYPNYCWQSLFYENHDNPRMVSKVNKNPKYRKPLAKLLAGIQLTLKGTPFIYQGQEIGMVNQKFSSMKQIKDVESINLYQDLIMETSEVLKMSEASTRSSKKEQSINEKINRTCISESFKFVDDMCLQLSRGLEHLCLRVKSENKKRKMYNGTKKAFKKILSGTRDHARTPVQWTSGQHAGFSNVKPWIIGDKDHLNWNAKAQRKDQDSVLNFYKTLIHLRKTNQTLVYGKVKFIAKDYKNYMAFYRALGDDIFLVECNLSSRIQKGKIKPEKFQKVLSNYTGDRKLLRPYELNIYRKKR